MSYSLDRLKQQNSNAFKGKGELMVGAKTSSLATLKSGALASKSGTANIQARVNNYAAQVIAETSVFMKENLTELIMLIDKSGSCKGLESATCEGYNNLIYKEKMTGFPAKVTTVLFDDALDEKQFRTDINSVPTLNYVANGGTSLYDCICSTILRVKAVRKNEVIMPTKTVVAIMTDGDDQHSHQYTKADTRRIIQECQSEGWEFIFLGSLANAHEIAADLGIKLQNSKQSSCTEYGMKSNFASISNVLDDLRNYGRITANWSSDARNNLQIEDKNVKRLGLK